MSTGNPQKASNSNRKNSAFFARYYSIFSKVNKNPLMAMAQVLHTQKLIVMPTAEYDALLKDFGEYEHQVVWMFNMA